MHIFPHTATQMRITRSGPTYTSIATISASISCLFSPRGSFAIGGPMGPYEQLDDMVFVDPDAAIEQNDVLIDNDSGEKWIIVDPPRKYKNPVTWEDSHWQAMIKTYNGPVT